MKVKNKCLHPIQLYKLTGTHERLIRCGTCSNCLRQRANELAVRAYREFHGQSVAFLTFTYRDDMMPIMHKVYCVDEDSGEMVVKDQSIVRGCGFFEEAPFEWRVYYDNGVKKLKRYHPLFKESKQWYGKTIIDMFYFTVYYEDIKLLFKRFRQNHPDRLDKWICVPEYGGKGYRPHYHMLVYGLTKAEIHSLAIDWNSRYGHCDIDMLDDHTDVQKVSQYVSKYCCKGMFDCPYIKYGYCIKPRRGISRDFGCGSPEDWQHYIEYVCAFDKFGNYDPLKVDPSLVSDKDVNFLITRRCYKIDGIPFPNPKFLLKKVFYEKQKFYDVLKGKVIYRTCASGLQKKVGKAILDDLASDARKREEEYIQLLNNFDFIDAFDRNDYSGFPTREFPTEVSAVPFDSDFASSIERDSFC